MLLDKIVSGFDRDLWSFEENPRSLPSEHKTDERKFREIRPSKSFPRLAYLWHSPDHRFKLICNPLRSNKSIWFRAVQRIESFFITEESISVINDMSWSTKNSNSVSRKERKGNNISLWNGRRYDGESKNFISSIRSVYVSLYKPTFFLLSFLVDTRTYLSRWRLSSSNAQCAVLIIDTEYVPLSDSYFPSCQFCSRAGSPEQAFSWSALIAFWVHMHSTRTSDGIFSRIISVRIVLLLKISEALNNTEAAIPEILI